VQRDTGSGYVAVIPTYDAKAQAGQAAVPANFQISLTGSTGGSNNIHEIDDLRVCATTIWPPSGGTASGFSAIDEAYGNASGSPKPAALSYLTGMFT
jgi:MSHA biogenesis protein MshQ